PGAILCATAATAAPLAGPRPVSTTSTPLVPTTKPTLGTSGAELSGITCPCAETWRSPSTRTIGGGVAARPAGRAARAARGPPGGRRGRLSRRAGGHQRQGDGRPWNSPQHEPLL